MELKAFNSERIYWAVEQVERVVGDIETLHLDDNQFYLKSEADKVIADLEESHKKEVEQLLIEIAELKQKLKNSRNARKYWRKEYLIEYKECRHNKYKRCLAMAKWCESEAYIHEQGSEYDEDLVAWFGKWYKRWLKIAEKFKDKEAK